MTTATGSSRSRQQQSRRGGQSTKQSSQKQSTGGRTGGGQSSQSSRTSRTSQSSRASREHAHATTVELPFVTARFHAPEMRLPSGEDINSAANSMWEQLPSREDSLFYGGLAAGAAFAMIEWPVALAIGVGYGLLSRGTRPQESNGSSNERSTDE